MLKKILVAGLIAVGANVAMANEIEGCGKVYNNAHSLSFTSNSTDKVNYAINQLVECAEKGDTESLVLAGKIFWRGEFIAKDNKRAADYWVKASNQGSWDAIVIISSVSADIKNKSSAEYDKSVQALRESIELIDTCGSNSNYAFELARLYNDHPNYISDYKKAVYYYRIASLGWTLPPSKAPERLADLKKDAPEVFEAEENEFKDQLAKAKKGSLEAMYRVGFAYEKGYGVDKNIVEAANWYKKSMKYQLSAVRWADIATWPELHPHSVRIYKLKSEADVAKYRGETEKESRIRKELEPLKSENSKSVENAKIQAIKIFKDAADKSNDTDSMINYWRQVNDRNNNTEYLEKAAIAGNMLAQRILKKVNDYNKKLKEGKPASMVACGAIIKNPFYDIY